jgi:Reverse transcriptase (RNA-dependent DNA polymerase)
MNRQQSGLSRVICDISRLERTEQIIITQLYRDMICDVATCFKIYNGVRQGGLLSPFLFRFYICDLINELDIGCNYFGTNINLVAYAADMVLLAPSWHGLQNLPNTIENAAIM